LLWHRDHLKRSRRRRSWPITGSKPSKEQALNRCENATICYRAGIPTCTALHFVFLDSITWGSSERRTGPGIPPMVRIAQVEMFRRPLARIRKQMLLLHETPPLRLVAFILSMLKGRQGRATTSEQAWVRFRRIEKIVCSRFKFRMNMPHKPEMDSSVRFRRICIDRAIELPLSHYRVRFDIRTILPTSISNRHNA
jgi:hypothetical protein